MPTRPTTSDLFLTDQDRNKVEEERKKTRSERNYLNPVTTFSTGKQANLMVPNVRSSQMHCTEHSEVKLIVPNVVKGPFYGTERPENSMVWKF